MCWLAELLPVSPSSPSFTVVLLPRMSNPPGFRTPPSLNPTKRSRVTKRTARGASDSADSCPEQLRLSNLQFVITRRTPPPDAVSSPLLLKLSLCSLPAGFLGRLFCLGNERCSRGLGTGVVSMIYGTIPRINFSRTMAALGKR